MGYCKLSYKLPFYVVAFGVRWTASIAFGVHGVFWVNPFVLSVFFVENTENFQIFENFENLSNF